MGWDDTVLVRRAIRVQMWFVRLRRLDTALEALHPFLYGSGFEVKLLERRYASGSKAAYRQPDRRHIDPASWPRVH